MSAKRDTEIELKARVRAYFEWERAGRPFLSTEEQDWMYLHALDDVRHEHKQLPTAGTRCSRLFSDALLRRWDLSCTKTWELIRVILFPSRWFGFDLDLKGAGSAAKGIPFNDQKDGYSVFNALATFAVIV
jgi:hypothetical protein